MIKAKPSSYEPKSKPFNFPCLVRGRTSNDIFLAVDKHKIVSLTENNSGTIVKSECVNKTHYVEYHGTIELSNG